MLTNGHSLGKEGCLSPKTTNCGYEGSEQPFSTQLCEFLSKLT